MYNRLEMKHIRPNSGLALITTMIVGIILLAMSGAIITLIHNQNDSMYAFSNRQRAYHLAKMGLEHAVASLNRNVDWSSADGTYDNGVALLDGTFSSSFSGGSEHAITVTGAGEYNNTQHNLTYSVNRALNGIGNQQDAHYISISTDNIIVTGIGHKRFSELALTNTNATDNISLEQIRVTWLDNDISEEVEDIDISGIPIAYSPDPASHASLITFNSGYVITSNESVSVNVLLNRNIDQSYFSIYFYFNDNSFKQVDFYAE